MLQAPVARAATVDSPPPTYRQTLWTEREGASPDLRDMAQTTDGYLWLATSAGLIRFDSVRFEDVDIPGHPELRKTSIQSMLATSDGGLWIGYTLGGVVFLKNGQATRYTERDGMPAGTVYDLAQERDGTLWAATSRGLARLVRGRWETLPETPPLKAGYRTLFVDGDDTLWVMQEGGVCYKPKGEAVFRLVPERHSDFAASIAQSPGGDVWMYADKVLQKIGHARQAAPVHGRSSSLAFQPDGSAWIVDGPPNVQGVIRIPATGLQQRRVQVGLSGTRPLKRADSLRGPIRALADDEGNLWIGGDSGLERVEDNDLMSLGPLHRQPNSYTTSQAPIATDHDGGLWIVDPFGSPMKGIPSVLLYRDHQVQRRFDLRASNCLVHTESGVWFGDQHGLSRIVKGRLTRFAAPEMTPSGIQSMTSDGHGGLWVSVVRKGVYHFLDGAWTLHPEMLVALVVATDPSGQLWLGYPDGRLAMFDGHTLRRYTTADGLGVGSISALEARRGQVWVGGSAGMARRVGDRFVPLHFEPEVAPWNVSGIVERESGDVWVLTAGGVVHIPRHELQSASDDPSHVLAAALIGPNEGIEGAEHIRPVPALIEGSDGKLWATTTTDIYAIDPDQPPRALKAPRVTIHDLVADGQPYSALRPISLSSRASSIRIAYTGVSLSSGKSVRYRYRLEGLDREWQDVGARTEASFTNLSPGAYRFRLQARFVGGPWLSEGTLEFTKAPTFAQTRIFLAMCVVGLLLFTWLMIGMRVWQVRRRLHLMFEARVSERERIARDLHDTLLQSSQGLVLKVHAATRRLATDNPDRAMLDAAVTDADLTLIEGRERIADLRKAGRTIVRLRQDLIAVGQALARDGDVAFTHSVQDAERELHPDIADEVFSIGREALLNAFRHARAQQVKLELADTRAGFALSVIDDGIGLDDAAIARAAASGHWGMAGMCERASRIGSQVEFSSRSGKGTEIVLSIPPLAAYRRASFWRLRA